MNFNKINLRFKRHHQENGKRIYRMGELFGNHISDKGLAYRIYKVLLQLNNTQTTQFLKNGQWI